MKTKLILVLVIFSFSIISCGGKGEKNEDNSNKIGETPKTETPNEAAPESTTKPSETIDLTNKGVGPIKNVTLDETIDQAMAERGKEVYEAYCMACHKVNKKFIGPPPTGIMERRTPEWIMNMIMDPEGMTKNDPLAHALLLEFNGTPMANQNMTEEQTREILEYFRTL